VIGVENNDYHSLSHFEIVVIRGSINHVTLRRETIVIALGLLLIAAAIPFAISETIEKGRVCLFSRPLLEELPQRFTGPGRFRFILQPTSWAENGC
jgi:hypothetical protein